MALLINGAMLMVTVLAIGACGLGPFAGEGGGGANLPSAGIGPYGELEIDRDTPIDEPNILADSNADLLEPSLIESAGGFEILVERRAGDVGEIWRAAIPSLLERPSEPLAQLLVASLDWQGGEVRAPSGARAQSGDLMIAYEAGDPAAIGIAIDRGSGPVAEAEPAVTDARSPSLAILDGTTFLFFERPSRSGIFVATSSDGVNFDVAPEPILLPSFRPMDFDRFAVRRPEGLVGTTVSGRRRFDLFYEGHSLPPGNEDNEIAIGYAGGFDLSELIKAAPLGEPILSPGAPNEEAPSVVIEPTGGIMLFTDRRSLRARISAATSP